jgi:hypothetical protein
MTAEIRLKTPGTQTERIHKRERNSGAGAHPNVTTQTNKGWHHNIHLSGHYVDPETRALMSAISRKSFRRRRRSRKPRRLAVVGGVQSAAA